jgi:hypothetical protein
MSSMYTSMWRVRCMEYRHSRSQCVLEMKWHWGRRVSLGVFAIGSSHQAAGQRLGYRMIFRMSSKP